MSTFQEFITSPLPLQKELSKIFNTNNPHIIFDIGACEGEDSIRYSSLFKNSIIYSFEPLPYNFNKCISNVSHLNHDRIKLFQLALSNKNGTSIFYVSSGRPDDAAFNDWNYGNKSSSLLPPDPSYTKYDWLKFNTQINVQTQTLESFCQEQKIDKIDYIHMDAQGSELNILQGAGDIIKTVSAIWLEVENISVYKEQPLKKDIEHFMKQIRFIKAMDTAFEDAGDQLYLNAVYFHKLNPFILKNRIDYFFKYVYFHVFSRSLIIKNLVHKLRRNNK